MDTLYRLIPAGVAALGLMAPAQAATGYGDAVADYCTSLSKVAAITMILHQQGAPAPDLMDFARRNAAPEIRPQAELLVLRAAQSTRFSRVEDRQQAAYAFGQRAFSNCLTSFGY